VIAPPRSRAAFASKQTKAQEELEKQLLGSARVALRKIGQKNWYKGLLDRAERALRARYRVESGKPTSPTLRLAVVSFRREVERSLKRTTKPEPEQIDARASALAASIATAAVNAALVAAARGSEQSGWQKVWHSMEDNRVRPTHAAVNGKKVPLGRTFEVGGHKMSRPGDMRAPIEEWINCRCILTVERDEDMDAIAAAGGEYEKHGVGIFLLPDAEDSVNAVSSEDRAHVTVVWLGMDDEQVVDVAELRAAVEEVSASFQPLVAEVDERGTLGDDEADVLFLSGDSLLGLRDALMANEVIAKQAGSVEQYPEWTPHLTLGYPDTPANDGTLPTDIAFDRLALWVGDDGDEFTLTGATMDPETDTEQVDEEFPSLAEADRLDYTDEPIPFWGVLAPEDVLSGDGRKFAPDALRTRNFPLPLSYQRENWQGHDSSIKVANIERAWRRNGLVYGMGHFLTVVPEVDEVVGMMAESAGRMGVSVDADEATGEMQTRDGQSVDELMEAMEPGDAIEIDLNDIVSVFTDARVAGGTLCHIPAFQEAFIALGTVPEDLAPQDGEDLLGVREEEAIAASAFRSVSDKPWDGSASRFTDEEWFRSTIVHTNGDSRVKSDNKLPILEPSGALSRAGVHAAAARVNQVDASPDLIAKAKGKLRSAYSDLGEEVPEAIKASGALTVSVTFRGTEDDRLEMLTAEQVATFVKTEDGPGWLTHPVDTDRLRDYWTHGKGAAKIGWGAPGDFNRCRTNLAKYVKPQYLSGYCANRHYDALGFWPGEHHSLDAVAASGEMDGWGLRLVASGSPARPPAAWFEDPHLAGPSGVTVTEDGRVFGHVAQWGVCHIGLQGVCTEAPPGTDYSYFHLGYVVADDDTEIPVGQITLSTGHADLKLNAKAAMAHYDNTGTAVADIRVGEDEFGIWCAGAMRPWATEQDVHELRAAKLSGDWREIRGGLEMVAALAVNVPGFPIPRTALAASGGHQTALIAAGIVTPQAEQETMEEIVSRAISKAFETRDRLEAQQRLTQIAAKTGRDPRSRLKRLAAARENH
jgi:hypothetical protein